MANSGVRRVDRSVALGPDTTRLAVPGRRRGAQTVGPGRHGVADRVAARRVDRWCRIRDRPGSTTTRSTRSGRCGQPACRPAAIAAIEQPVRRARTRARLRWSTVSSARPKSRRRAPAHLDDHEHPRRPGSTATRSSSPRPTRTLRARIVQPACDERARRRAPRRRRRACCAASGPQSAVRPSPSRGAHRTLSRRVTGAGSRRRVGARAVERGRAASSIGVVGHDRARLALEQLVRRGRGRRDRRAGRKSSWSPASVRWRARNERRWNGVSPSRADRHPVVERGIALVVLPAVARVARGEAGHHPVADDLGDDRGARDRVDLGVAVDDVRVRPDVLPRSRRSGCRRR